MESKDNRHSDIDAILKGIFKETSLRDIFDKRLHELKITQTAAQKMLGIERRTLNGILDGTQKRVNYKSLQKLAVFLNMPQDEVYESVASLLDKNFAEENTPTNKKKFIQENFDLVVLKKAGFIDTITDFNRIEERIVSYFGFNSIFEYKKRAFSTAFFVGVSTPKTTTTRDFWLTNARGVAAKIDNPYPYDRQKLIDYFPQIRWNSTNVELGLVNVIKSLFKLGVTVLFQAPMSALQLRGATMSVNNKPCVVMTDYKGFYPTLWHSLIHELYHVLFDWEEINENNYPCHISEDLEEMLIIDEGEAEANDFARKYLFSSEKMEGIKMFIWDHRYINEIAKQNNIHPSIIHSYYAFDNNKTDRMAWARARRLMPEIKKAVFRVENNWDRDKSIDEIAKKLKLEIYN